MRVFLEPGIGLLSTRNWWCVHRIMLLYKTLNNFLTTKHLTGNFRNPKKHIRIKLERVRYVAVNLCSLRDQSSTSFNREKFAKARRSILNLRLFLSLYKVESTPNSLLIYFTFRKVISKCFVWKLKPVSLPAPFVNKTEAYSQRKIQRESKLPILLNILVFLFIYLFIYLFICLFFSLNGKLNPT